MNNKYINYGIQYNIYFGKLNAKYRFTKTFKKEEEAIEFARKTAESWYYKNEGRHGIPSFDQITLENELTGVDMETLYKDHINDLMRWYAIPTEVDTILEDDIKY